MDMDLPYFDPVIEQLNANIVQMAPVHIITDPLEYYNPLHDIANTITDILITKAGQRGQIISKLIYANEYPNLYAPDTAVVARQLSDKELLVKKAQISAYLPLNAEHERLKAAGGHQNFDCERVYADEVRLRNIPPAHTTKFAFNFYEEYGRAAVARGAYQSHLTFDHHAKPFAHGLIDRHLKLLV